jgi:phosphoribosylamine--glycine ligase
MKILVVGSGAREHSLVKKFSSESSVEGVICAPGNAGIKRENLTDVIPLNISDSEAILSIAEAENVDLTVVGPELPLANGVSDLFLSHGRFLFGPTKSAARLESSKTFAKLFMARHAIPTAGFEVCESYEQALGLIRNDRFGSSVVVKADGLAAGKGVTVAEDRTTAEAAIRDAMVERRFGDAGTNLVLEECLTGPEVSYFVITDGTRFISLPPAQDHKRVFDNDLGPNTGGMGAFAPSPLLTPDLEQSVIRDIVEPTIKGMRQEGNEYRGVLYVGLMLTDKGPQVIEFNVRFGDPEAQIVLPMVESELAPVLLAAAKGDLGDVGWQLSSEPHIGVVMASGGYPGKHETGFSIVGIDGAEKVAGVHVVHAGTVVKDEEIVTNGGRVLTVVARGGSFPVAIERAYKGVDRISFQGSHARTDIGQGALYAHD